MLQQLAEQSFTSENEQILIEEVKQGNKQAWESIAKALYAPLMNYVLSMVREKEIAEELVQDVFVNFWIKRAQITINTSLKAYLYRAAKNHTLNFIKRRKFELEYQKKLAQELVVHKNDTEDTFQFSQLEKTLSKAIEELPENCKEIFMLSRFEDMTYKEISETLNIPIRTVHYQIGLALKDLRKKLKGHVNPNLI